MLRAMILLCLNLLLVQGPVFGRDLVSTPQVQAVLDLQSARQYMVVLINQDRASMGLKPVELDEVATAAGQVHSDDMAVSKYISHWDPKGRKPDQRYSQVGGQGAVSENVLVTHNFLSSEKYQLAEQQVFKKEELERMEGLFFNETAPNDGHRVNILNPNHNKVGIGLSLIQPGNRVACTQEFVNQYGQFSTLPEQTVRGENLPVKGALSKGVSLYAIELKREQAPEPMTVAQLMQTHSYTLPTENVMRYYPPPYVSPPGLDITHSADGDKFSLSLKAHESWKPGLYYVMVWVKTPDSDKPVVTSSRTVAIN